MRALEKEAEILRAELEQTCAALAEAQRAGVEGSSKAEAELEQVRAAQKASAAESASQAKEIEMLQAKLKSVEEQKAALVRIRRRRWWSWIGLLRRRRALHRRWGHCRRRQRCRG